MEYSMRSHLLDLPPITTYLAVEKPTSLELVSSWRRGLTKESMFNVSQSWQRRRHHRYSCSFISAVLSFGHILHTDIVTIVCLIGMNWNLVKTIDRPRYASQISSHPTGIILWMFRGWAEEMWGYLENQGLDFVGWDDTRQCAAGEIGVVTL